MRSWPVMFVAKKRNKHASPSPPLNAQLPPLPLLPRPPTHLPSAVGVVVKRSLSATNTLVASLRGVWPDECRSARVYLPPTPKGASQPISRRKRHLTAFTFLRLARALRAIESVPPWESVSTVCPFIITPCSHRQGQDKSQKARPLTVLRAALSERANSAHSVALSSIKENNDEPEYPNHH